jgi:hypothetical protein
MSPEEAEIQSDASPLPEERESVPHFETVARTVSGSVAAGAFAALFGPPAIVPVVAALFGSFAGYYAKRLDTPSSSEPLDKKETEDVA